MLFSFREDTYLLLASSERGRSPSYKQGLSRLEAKFQSLYRLTYIHYTPRLKLLGSPNEKFGVFTKALPADGYWTPVFVPVVL